MENIPSMFAALIVGAIISYLFMKKKNRGERGFLKQMKEGKSYYFIRVYEEKNASPQQVVIVLCETLRIIPAFSRYNHGRERYYSYQGKTEGLIHGTEYVAFSPNEQVPLVLYTKEQIKTLKEAQKK